MLFGNISILNAQQLPVKVYKQIDDIDLNGVSSVLQDDKQLLWIGTGSGIYWYDGKSIFKPKQKSLPEALIVTSIIQGKDSSVYICSHYDGLFKYINNKFLKINSDNSVKTHSDINDVIFLNKNTIIAADENGLYEINNNKLSSLKIEHYQITQKVQQIATLNDTCFVLLFSDNNNVGIVSKRFGKYNVKFIHFENGWQKVLKISNHIWCSNGNILYKFNDFNDFINGKVNLKLNTHDEIWNFFTDGNEKIWIRQSKTVLLVHNDSLVKLSSKIEISNNVESLCFDKDGNTWFACGADGLIKLKPQQYMFTDFTNLGYDEVFISGRKYNSTKNIYCAFSCIFIQEKNKIIQVKKINDKSIEFPSMLGNDNEGNLIFYDNNGIILFKENKFKRLFNLEIQSAVLNQNKEVLLISSGHLIKYFEGIIDTIKLRKPIYDYISTMLIDSKSRLWLGLKNGGVCLLDKEYNFLGSNLTNSGLRMRALFENNQGDVYLGTRNNGLYYCRNTDLKTGIFSPIYIQGIAGSWIKKFALLNDSLLLICHEKGVDLINTKTDNKVIEHFKFYNDEALIEPFGMSNMGSNFIITTRKGFFTFFPTSALKRKNVPKVYFKQIYINGEIDTSIAPYSTQQFVPKYTYTQNNFKFNFVAISFNEILNINYKYRLLGSSNKWLELNHVNELNFANIPPGKYRLEIAATEGSQMQNFNAAIYEFEILAPYYQTVWFKALVLLFILTVIYVTVSYIFKRNLKEKILILEKEQALEKERNRISQDMHDDLGSGLTKIAILSEVTKKEISDTDKAKNT